MKPIAPAIEFAKNYVGLLPSHIKSALYNYVEFPTQDNWNDIYSTVISTGKTSTVWQAVLAYDPSFPDRIPVTAIDPDNVRWPRIPSPEVFAKAIAIAIFSKSITLN